MKIHPSPFHLALLCLFFITFPPQNSFAQEHQEGPGVKISRISSPVKLDGLSDEPAWQDIEPFPMTVQQPVFGMEPTEQTEIRVGFDDEYIYAAGRFYDSEPEKIQDPYRKRDNIGLASDWFWLGLDCFNDNENALVFMTAPSGLRVDYTIFNDGVGMASFNLSWDTYWDVATVRNDKGWFAEMRIPLSSLRFRETESDAEMGMVVGRTIARKPEVTLYPAIPNKWGFWSITKPSKMQDVVFEGIRARKPLYIAPYVLGGFGRTKILNEQETAYINEDQLARNAGLDVKYGLTSNLTMDLTVNTDFAQVEADEQQVNLTRYSLFFPEKRLFFQERSSNFEFDFGQHNRLFHSRRIGIHQGEKVGIYGGARVVGRVGRWDVGFLDMQTQKADGLPSENFGVLRLRRRVINEKSYVGGIATSRIGLDSTWNTVYGLDGVLRLLGDNIIRLKWAQSFENNSENDPISLDPSRIQVNLENPSYDGLGYDLDYSRAGKTWNPGIGYERREDFSRLGNALRYGWTPGENSKIYRHYTFLEGYTYMRNADWSLESSKIGWGWDAESKTGYSGNLGVYRYDEDVLHPFYLSADAEIPAGRYTFYGVEGFANTPYTKLTNFESYFMAGSFYDGRRLTMSVTPLTNIGSFLELSCTYELNRIAFTERNQQFISHLGLLRAVVMLSTRHSLTSLVQYNSVTDKIITNIRYRYNPREGVDLYIVYDEGLNTDRYREVPALPVSPKRTLLIKYTYTFNVQL
ncbi:MAG: DUF5916 domain-containing protein [Bacteroidales bacterium]